MQTQKALSHHHKVLKKSIQEILNTKKVGEVEFKVVWQLLVEDRNSN